MDTAALDELRELRARAYGPDADIDQDPVALRRLHELETLHAGPVPSRPQPDDASGPEWEPAPDAEPPSSQDGDSARLPGFAKGGAESNQGTTGSETEPQGGDEGTAPADAARRRRTRRVSPTGVLWALSVLAAAALAAGGTYAVMRMPPVPVSSGAPQIATLEPDPLATVPAGWMGAGPSSDVFEFYGLTLFQTASGFAGYGRDCLAVMATEQLPEEDSDSNTWSYQGNLYGGCRAGGFPAVVQFEIGSDAPEALSSRFGDGNALQFVYDGERIGVYLDTRSARS
ncbi:hypothetical protein [Microbacterium timonense]|uniref:hypothetical protein n=1 Tax=Microbacterium timonense TaxID=2086576 RepID=UPI000D10C5CB|nr:hypothetical protein [Microbacterium timonense]